MGTTTLKIDHDHEHLHALLTDLGDAILALHKGEGPRTDQLEQIDEALTLVKEDTYEHFEREEHGIFPNLESEFPDLADTLADLREAHDQICGLLEALEQLVKTNDVPSKDVVDCFDKLNTLFQRHSHEEWALLRSLIESVDEDRRAVIIAQLQDI